jgi:hypothetical protein
MLLTRKKRESGSVRAPEEKNEAAKDSDHCPWQNDSLLGAMHPATRARLFLRWLLEKEPDDGLVRRKRPASG